MRARNTVVTIEESPVEEESFSRIPILDDTLDAGRSSIISSMKERKIATDPVTSPNAVTENKETCDGMDPNKSEHSTVVVHLTYVMSFIRENELSWRDDFLLFHMMSIPKSSELFMRLNLNVPYYIFNYIQLMFLVTFPMLLWYNIPYLLILAANVWCSFLIVHDSFAKTGKKRGYIQVLQYNVRFLYFGHFFLAAWVFILVFFNGVKTSLYVTLVNLAVVIPHALLRRPTFFDDEEMEKLRPKMVNYVLMLLFILLSYLEGDITGPEEENLKRSEEERKRIKAFLQLDDPEK